MELKNVSNKEWKSSRISAIINLFCFDERCDEKK